MKSTTANRLKLCRGEPVLSTWQQLRIAGRARDEAMFNRPVEAVSSASVPVRSVDPAGCPATTGSTRPLGSE